MSQPITNLPGVGRAKAVTLAKLGVRTVRDLLYHFPRAYQNRGDIRTLVEAGIEGAVCSTLLTIGTEPRSSLVKGRMTLTKFQAFDNSGSVAITFFNQGYLENRFKLGSSFRFWGKVERAGRTLSMSSPAFEPYYDGASLPEFVAVYPLTEGLTNAALGSLVDIALHKMQFSEAETLPERVRSANNLPDLRTALEYIHNPRNYEQLERGRNYFIFEELYLFALGMALLKEGAVKDARTAPAFEKVDLAPLTGRLGFALTGAQRRAVDDIISDLTRSEPAHRLISGDVGSGKTVPAMAALYIAAKSSYQAAMMAPTEILAIQHYNDISPIFAALGIGTTLLIGALSPTAKRAAHEKIASGECDIVIGTHAVISESVEFARLGLVITDEQHRFGVKQRLSLGEKAKTVETVHCIVMSATPIPRTLGLILYGDLNLSVLDEMPPGRQKIDTFTVDESMRERINAFIMKQIVAGGRVYVVCPAVEEREERSDREVLVDIGFRPNDEKRPPIKAATAHAEELRNALPTARIGVMHGRLRGAEKESIMRDFAEGRLDILVSTTVIEVGVNVPEATLMVVENAERFGLSQLHQLRGRVGRGKSKSYCVLFSQDPTQTAKERLETLAATNDGFVIAEKDLSLRGPGDLLMQSETVRQSGDARFKIAGLCENMNVLQAASVAAKETLLLDPTLESPENATARGQIGIAV